MILKTLFITLAGMAVWKVAKASRAMPRRDQLHSNPRPESRWEDEGGALPQSGAQLGPQPTVVSQSA